MSRLLIIIILKHSFKVAAFWYHELSVLQILSHRKKNRLSLNHKI